MKNTGKEENPVTDTPAPPKTIAKALTDAAPKELTGKEKVKADVAQTKAQLNQLAALEANCAQIKQEKRLVIAEDTSDKDKKPEDGFKFALTGDVVLKVMLPVDAFIGDMKNRAIMQQDKLIDELNKLI